jgi:hypothetical protein
MFLFAIDIRSYVKWRKMITVVASTCPAYVKVVERTIDENTDVEREVQPLLPDNEENREENFYRENKRENQIQYS